MIKRNNKKGFTIVELVIVIAVIAILAAVLIPTFAGIIKKAQLSSDQQAVRNMNVALAASGDLEGIDAAIDALAENGFNSKKALIPVSSGLSFYWNPEANVVCLVKEEDKSVLFPDGDYTFADTWKNLGESAVYIDIVANDENSFADALTAGQKDVKLDADITVQMPINTPADAETTIDLGGKKLTTGERNIGVDHQYAINVSGVVTITNGTIDARGVQVMPSGKLILGEGVTINAVDSNGGAAIWVYEGGELVIEGGTYTALNGNKNLVDTSKNPGVVSNNGGKVTIKGGTFKTEETVCYVINNNKGELVIEGGSFEGTHGIVAVEAGTAKIDGGTFTLKPFADGTFTGHIIYTGSSGSAVVNGGTFEGHTSVFYGNVTDNRNK